MGTGYSGKFQFWIDGWCKVSKGACGQNRKEADAQYRKSAANRKACVESCKS